MKKLRLLLPLALMAYLASGFYVVAPDEQAVVRCFGRVVGPPRLPGLQFDLPWGLCRIDRVKPAETKRLALGRIGGRWSEGGEQDSVGQWRSSEYLTGDQNILHVAATVQYTIASPIAYVVRVREVETLLAAAAESELARAIAQRNVDYIRAEGGVQLQQQVLTGAQRIVDGQGLGVVISSVNLDSVLPPGPVIDFFRQANDARHLRELLIHQAEAEERRKVEQAHSQAQEALDGAEAYRAQVVQQARGASDRFLAHLEEYRHAKTLTATRLYLETMERVLPRLRAKLVVGAGEEVDLSILRSNPQ